MLDIQFIRDNPDVVKEKSKQKGFKVDVDKLLGLDGERKNLLLQVEELRAKRNNITERIKKSGKPDQKLIDEGKQIKVQLAEREKYFNETNDKWSSLLKQVPNMPLDEVPVGSSEEDNKVMATVGDKPKFGFDPKSHVDIGEQKGWIDKERAAKVAGARFVYLKGDLVRLEFALMQYGIDKLSDESFIEQIIKENKLDISNRPFEPILPPAMARTEIYESTARLDKEEMTYKLADGDLWLNASAEHTLAPMFSGEIIDEADLPLRYVGYTTAFRREAGSYGKDTEGIIRLHQFNKLEMESFTKPEDGLHEHMFMAMIQRKLMEELKIPYQLIQKCTADIGGPNASGWDINCWMPGQNAYRETHTADYMTDYQARRMKTKYRRGENDTKLVHTNDATVFSERQLVAIIENNQTKDGDVKVPKALQKYMGGKEAV